MEGAYGRLDDIIDSSVRTIIAQNQLPEAVRNSNVINEIEREIVYSQAETDSEGGVELAEVIGEDVVYETIEKGRRDISDEMLARAGAIAPQYGIDLIDIVIRQIRYSDDLTEDVYRRMITERNKIAQAFRSHGQGRKQEWLGRLENEQKAIISGAYETSEEIRGQADAQATAIYSESYQKDPEFFKFWRSIESYRKLLPNFKKTLSTDMDYFDFLYSGQGQ